MTAPTGHLGPGPDGTECWEINGVEGWTDCLFSVVSPDDHWMFVSSRGGLTAGRRDRTRCLFPYETDDRLHHCADQTGPVTLVRAGDVLWQPFDPRGLAPGRRRTIRKAAEGHWLEFEEHAPDLGLTFRYRWLTSQRFGLVRRATLEGSGQVRVLDGFRNLMPAGVPHLAQQGLSSLVDAYKRSEVDDVGFALFAMEAYLTDQAAPEEALRANAVWRIGLPGATTHLTQKAVADFRAGRTREAAPLVLGERHAYLVEASVDLDGGAAEWLLVGDVHLDHVALTALAEEVRAPGVADALRADIEDGARRLVVTMASSDGLQHTADRAAVVHHFANVVFNTMRGGVFAHHHDVSGEDVRAFIGERNRVVAERHAAWAAELPARLSHPALMERARGAGDPQLERLCMEYLPLTFSRRHGDPSRPWNAFTIDLVDERGEPRYGYEGNWRDIFQNWEALCTSFPHFLVPIVAKFVNASTVDGFNPYRITREGVDWEEPNPEDPWSNIGYWGDHQIVYLFRLIELAQAHHPGAIRELLTQRRFSSADVPYRLRSYAELCRDAKDAIVFDDAANAAAHEREAGVGGDGRLVFDDAGQVALVTLLEKLLVSVLAKLSNFVPDGGIWLNTQRPEWNDANNALVGQGLSVVTLAHLRRALVVLQDLVQGMPDVPVSAPVAAWLGAVSQVFTGEGAVLRGEQALSAGDRRRVLDRLGQAFSAYREQVYATPYTSTVLPVSSDDVVDLCRSSLRAIDPTLARSRRSDGLFHSYNLLALDEGTAEVSHLYEMLEGQVAMLGSGLLDPEASVALVDAMFESALYREDQASFLLYPFRDRTPFLQRNQLQRSTADGIGLLRELLAADDRRLVCADTSGTVRFHADLSNAEVVEQVLDGLASESRWAGLVKADRQAVLDAYERVFDHHSFTGRSGTMYKYEGLGSIYWHMVSKLLVSAQEAWWAAVDGGASADALAALADRYYKVRRGLSFNKTVAEYGATPSDPYSHTPRAMGAQQPGMTGQVKEEILTRRGEVGVRVDNGGIRLQPVLLRRRELLEAPARWRCETYAGVRDVKVPASAVGFTVCQVPFVLVFDEGGAQHIDVSYADGRKAHIEGASLGAEVSAAVFARDGQVTEIRATVPRTWLTID